MIVRDLHRCSALALVLAAGCATVARRDIQANFATQGVGKPTPLNFQSSDNAATIGKYQIGSLPDTKPGDVSVALALEGKVVWVAVGKVALDRSGDTMRLASVQFVMNSAKTATRTWTLDIKSTDTYQVVGTISGPENLTLESFPADRTQQGMYVGWDGGYLLKDGKILAAFDWSRMPETLLLSDAVDEDMQQLLLTAATTLWLQKHEIDKAGRSAPRNPPLGHLKGVSPTI